MSTKWRLAIGTLAMAGIASLSFYAGNVSAAERHPAINAAVDALVKARFDLQHAAHDFGGHRVKALEATDAALQQLKICLKYDR
ncbi:MAG TPA: hypothetical protein VFW04_11735 [Gemmatimonadaceae bacterium]|jgi:hypothetical protein|nr:hypothetical protein [Gemmatimonadaceae bacterium]